MREPKPGTAEFNQAYGRYLGSGAIGSWESWVAAQPEPDTEPVPYDIVTPSLERTTDKTGRRGADWRLGLTRRAMGDADDKWASTNVEWMTQSELLVLWLLIGQTFHLGGL